MSKNQWKAPLITAGLVGAGAVAGCVASGIMFKMTMPRPKGTSDKIVNEFAEPEKFQEYMEKSAPLSEWAQEQSYEDVYITARDDIRLHALYFPAENSDNKIVIFHHGYTSKAIDNVNHLKFFHDMGYDALLLDLRAHGESGGKYVGYGVLDRFDTQMWVRYVRERFGNDIRIVLHGTSMGATTALMALGVPEVQKEVSAVIADCGFTSRDEIFAHVVKKNYHLPTFPMMQINNLYSKKAAGYKGNEYSTVDALENNQVPVLFIHGEKDKFVPVWMSKENYRVCGASLKKLLIVENAGHGSSIFEDRELYERTEKEFLDEVFEFDF